MTDDDEKAARAAAHLASDPIAQAALQAAAEGRLPPPPLTGPCPLCTFEGATDSGCPACGSRFFRVVTLRDPEGQAVATPPLRPEVVAAARRIKRALLAEADRAAGIDTSRPRTVIDTLDPVLAELAGDLSMTQAERLLRETVPPLLELLARVREIIDASVERRTALAAIDGWADIRDALYPDTDEARITREARARRAAGEPESWAAGCSDIPDRAPTCDECGATLAEVHGRSASGRELRGTICLRCNADSSLLQDDEDT